MQKFKVMRAWDRGRNKIAYVYRDSETKNVKIGETSFNNWFYVLSKDFVDNKRQFNKFQDDGIIKDMKIEGRYAKISIETTHKNELFDKDMEFVWEYKRYAYFDMMNRLELLKIPTFEADVLAYKRWLIQENVEMESEYVLLYYDIETDDRHKDSLTPGAHRILSISAKFSDTSGRDGKMFWICTEEDTDEAECAMLKKFAKLVRRADVLISFNGSFFDDPYIKARFARYQIEVDWRKKQLQDHCWTYKKYGPKLQSYKLDAIAKSVVKRGKIEHVGMRVYDMWKSDRKLLKEYNDEDVQLMYDIELESGYLQAHRDVNVMGMCPVEDIYVSRKIDNFILRQAQEDQHYHFPTLVKNYEEDTETKVNVKGFEGAFVFKPKSGRYKDTKVVDFASLYPNAINTHGISLDTLIEPGDNSVPDNMIVTNPTRHRYRKDFIGIIPKVIMLFQEKRNYYKDLMSKEVPGSTKHKLYDRMQYVYKFMGLSFYGVMGEKHNRMYDVRVAETVTLTGQYYTKLCAKYIEKNKMTIIYGDTDSLFVDGITDKMIWPVVNKLNQLCELHAFKKFNCDVCTIKMDYDKGFSVYLALDAKKRYAGVLSYLDGHEITEFNMYVAGLEYKRTDGCEILKTVQYDILKRVLQDDEVPDVDIIRDIVLGLRNKVFAGELSIEDITLAQKITKDLDEYSGRNMHVMVAREMIAEGKEFYQGDKIPYFIIGMNRESKPIPVPRYKFEGRYCESYYWNNKIFPALQRVIEVVYPKIKWEDYKVASKGEVKIGKCNLW